MSKQNLNPDQRNVPREVRRVAFARIAETCPLLTEILDDAVARIAQNNRICLADIPGLDYDLRLAFQRIRDDITQCFRTEQMRLIEACLNANCQLPDPPTNAIGKPRVSAFDLSPEITEALQGESSGHGYRSWVLQHLTARDLFWDHVSQRWVDVNSASLAFAKERPDPVLFPKAARWVLAQDAREEMRRSELKKLSRKEA